MNFSILIFFTALKNPLEYGCSRGIMLVKYLYARSAALIKLCSLEVSILCSCVRSRHEQESYTKAFLKV